MFQSALDSNYSKNSATFFNFLHPNRNQIWRTELAQQNVNFWVEETKMRTLRTLNASFDQTRKYLVSNEIAQLCRTFHLSNLKIPDQGLSRDYNEQRYFLPELH